MLYLASQSPRRRELLAQIGVAHAVLTVDVPEVPGADEPPEGYVQRVAREKARAGWASVAAQDGAVVLAADTEVILDGRIYGKPATPLDATDMLRSLSGRTHLVISAVCCIDGARELETLSRSEVRFATLSDAVIAAYVATGEAMGRAGAYAIQGRAGAFIEHLDGSHSGVMGLPVHETAGLLAKFGIGPLAA